MAYFGPLGSNIDQWSLIDQPGGCPVGPKKVVLPFRLGRATNDPMSVQAFVRLPKLIAEAIRFY